MGSQPYRTLVKARTLEDVHNTVRELHLRQLGLGSTRRVYALSKTRVLKVAIRASAVYQNFSEWATWRDIGHTYTWLAKVYEIHVHGFWIVAERCRPYRGQPLFDSDYPKPISDMLVEASRAGIRDLHEGNFGTRLTGGSVIFDYGISR